MAPDPMARRVDYDHIAKTYDRRYQENDYSGVEAALTAFVGEHLDQRVLEVGCGTGHWLRSFRGTGLRVTGLDASAQMLAYAKTQAPRAALAQGTAERLPLASETFDRVFCINAFHHFQDKVAFLIEAMRVLRPGGLMMTVGLDPHAGVDQWYIYEYFDNVLEIDRRRYPASSQIREWMQASGFADCVTREIQHLPVRLGARAALEQGRLEKSVTSQLSVLTDEEHRQGVDRIREAVKSAEARGESLDLTADLRLYATFGAAPSRVKRQRDAQPRMQPAAPGGIMSRRG
jgi:ubiquinone/menaquinone biosynthesis C-methylase UbiE